MAKSRAILKRRKAVQNIRKITRTMQLISTARFQRAFNRAMAFKSYSEKIAQMVSNVSEHAEVDHPLLRKVDRPERLAMLFVTSNRGLCGGYNSRVLHTGVDFFKRQRAEGSQIELAAVGKKGLNYLRFMKLEVARRYVLPDSPSYQEVEEISNQYRSEFAEGKVDAVFVAHMQFCSTSRQVARVLQLLPVTPSVRAETEKRPASKTEYVQYDFTPSAGELLAELLPEAVNVALYQCFIDAVVSEQVARMVAMKAATDNAEEMIKLLTRQANRARQAQITRELTELMAGSEGR